MRNFLTRALVAIIAIPALLWVFHSGGGWIRWLVSLLILVANYEVWQVAQLRGYPLSLPIMCVSALAFPWVVISAGGGPVAWIGWIATAFLLNALWVIWRRDPVIAMQTVLMQLTAVFWIGLGFGALLGLRGSTESGGFHWLVLLFATLWIGDTAAYLGGSAIGGPKLSPAISPHKTIAGAAAQIIASVAVGVVLVLIQWIDAPTALVVSATALVGIVGQIGDLFESVFKRAAGVKDFSSIIPGHGGVLDRFDSTLLAAPALWALIQLWPR
jgi:phosphatidate cytidylyltransferase